MNAIKFIIQFKPKYSTSVRYYAGSVEGLPNIWTMKPEIATRFISGDTALDTIEALKEKFPTDVGQYFLQRIEIQYRDST